MARSGQQQRETIAAPLLAELPANIRTLPCDVRERTPRAGAEPNCIDTAIAGRSQYQSFSLRLEMLKCLLDFCGVKWSRISTGHQNGPGAASKRSRECRLNAFCKTTLGLNLNPCVWQQA